MGDRVGDATTVLGPVAATDLGTVLPHEHLLVRLWQPPEEAHLRFDDPLTITNLGRIRQDWGHSNDNVRLTSVPIATRELARFAAAGGGTLVDLTQAGIGRDPRALVRMSRATGVHIVMGFGAYVVQTHPAWLAGASVAEMTDVFLGEARDGVDGTGVRPGIIGELGCSWPLHDVERRVLQAGTRVQAATGLAITIHPGRHPVAPIEIIDVLEAAGADLGRVVIGHLDRTVQDLPGLLAIAARGPYLEFDLFGLETSFYPWPGVAQGLSDAQRLDLIRGLFDAGHGGRVLASQDVCTKHRLARYGGHGYDHLLTNVAPWMLTRGFNPADVDLVFRTNPAAVLARVAPRS